jgi:hypothetical protein
MLRARLLLENMHSMVYSALQEKFGRDLSTSETQTNSTIVKYTVWGTRVSMGKPEEVIWRAATRTIENSHTFIRSDYIFASQFYNTFEIPFRVGHTSHTNKTLQVCNKKFSAARRRKEIESSVEVAQRYHYRSMICLQI